MRAEISATEIRRTLRRAAVRTAFQPLWDLRRGEVFGYEALARFEQHTPPRWFQAARHHGLELPLNRLACRQAIGDFSRLAEEVPHALLFLNASSPASAVEVGRIARESPHTEQIVVELTEGLVDQAEHLVYVVDELRRGGLRLAVDDMGYGLSDRHRFQLLAPEVMKIDRQVIARCVAGDRGARGKLREYVALAESTGCLVLAEGIEHEEWLTDLADRGVALAQGFAVGRPASAGALLAAGRSRAPLSQGRPDPRAATLPEPLGKAMRQYLGAHLEDVVGAGFPAYGREGVPPQTLRALLLVLEEGSHAATWDYGGSAELGRRIAAVEAQGVEVAQAFSYLRGYLTHRLAEKGVRHGDKLQRIGDWLDALEIEVLRRRERLTLQREAFRDEELAQRARQSAILRELLTSLGEGRLDDLVPQRAAQLVGADGVAIVLTSRDGTVRDMLTHPCTSDDVREATAAWLRRAGPLGSEVRHRIGGGIRHLDGPFSSMASLPIAFDGEPIGVLAAWRREPVKFSRRDTEALGLLAGQIAAATHAYARLGEVVRRERELLVLEETATALRDVREAPEAARELLASLRRLFSAESYFVALWDSATGRVTTTLATHPASAASLASREITAVTQWVCGEGEPLFLREGGSGFGDMRSVAAAPILAGGEALGAVGALDYRDRRIDARAVETLERAAALFSLAQARFEHAEPLALGD